MRDDAALVDFQKHLDSFQQHNVWEDVQLERSPMKKDCQQLVNVKDVAPWVNFQAQQV